MKNKTSALRSYLAAALIGAVVFGLSSFSGAYAAGNTVTVKGSDTMVILGQRWAEDYMKKFKGIVIQVTGGGSGTGIAALTNGLTDIAQSSRPMKEKEKSVILEKRKKHVEEIPVAVDGIAVYVHQSNPIEKLDISQLKAVYTGRVKKWSALADFKEPLITYGRENNSGTYAYFKEHVLGNEDFAPEALSLPGTAAVINAVSKDKKAIGYGGIAYAHGVKVIKVASDAKSQAYAPSLENVMSGKYPISRSLFFYTAGKSDGEVKKFIAWILGKEGQKVCGEVGYYPLPVLRSKARK